MSTTKQVMPYSLETSYTGTPDEGHLVPLFILTFAIQEEDAAELTSELYQSLFKLVDLTIEILEEGEVQNG